MSKNNSNGGAGVLGILGVLFVGLKLANVIDWSWWYVTMPFWIGLPIAVIFLVIIIILENRK
ncbi:hypothetical protein Phi19:1_gp018 [Cellulophaga phage phi19:1]|uniref:Transmembrane protein n=1 Tax=Cellulophaga phage phi19:1 TaxID=1327970 RepID=R9ZZC1_9CAUD|nr:hypothetical protein Phi19:1_gp018 [Cellulophaga phage phi19:1]AGO47308.1 hypothetical protein Phi19:1_gp018 [Cellulophaga phage phi19:1]